MSEKGILETDSGMHRRHVSREGMEEEAEEVSASEREAQLQDNARFPQAFNQKFKGRIWIVVTEGE